jgi:hypothetical protein
MKIATVECLFSNANDNVMVDKYLNLTNTVLCKNRI